MLSGHRRALLIAGLALVIASCTPPSDAENQHPTELPADDYHSGRSFQAVWLIDAEAVGADGPGYPYRYVEVVDDRTGRYLVQSPNHLALQTADETVFCAAIFRPDPYCSSTERADNTPPVLSYPIQLLRGWSPSQLYDLASWREVALEAQTEPQVWDRRFDVVRDRRVECFVVTGETNAARTGFEVCFTDDDLHLVASVDLSGDLVYEIDLVEYSSVTDSDAFATGLDEFIEAKPSLQDQLITLYPEIPAPRPTPTPDPDAPGD